MLEREVELWQMRVDIAEFHMLRIAGEQSFCTGCEHCFGRVCELEIPYPDLPKFRGWSDMWCSAHNNIYRIRFKLRVLSDLERTEDVLN